MKSQSNSIAPSSFKKMRNLEPSIVHHESRSRDVVGRLFDWANHLIKFIFKGLIPSQFNSGAMANELQGVS